MEWFKLVPNGNSFNGYDLKWILDKMNWTMDLDETWIWLINWISTWMWIKNGKLL